MRLLTTIGLALLVGCTSGDKDVDTDDTADDSGSTDTSDTSTDTADTSDTDTGGDTGPIDTDSLCPGLDTADPAVMAGLGETPLDGDWVGRFRIRETYPQAAPWSGAEAVCEGDISLTVDGCGGVHIFGNVLCEDWDPNMPEIPLQFPVPFPLPLPEEYGISGGVFYDVGSLWGLDETNDNVLYEDFTARQVVGVSLFWDTPIGPLRFNFSEALSKEKFDEEQTFDLTISTQF